MTTQPSKARVPAAWHSLRQLTALLTLLPCALAAAQQLEPRAYSNLPVGMNFVASGLGYVTGDVASDPSQALDDAEIDAWLPVVAWARAIEIRGRSAKLDVIAPLGCTSGEAVYQDVRYQRDVCGLGDPSVKLSLNLYGAPAMSLRELASWQQELIIGAGMRVGMPLGQYDGDKLLNVGSNRWYASPEIGMSKALGRFTLEMIAAATLFGDNDDYFGQRKREQDPVYSLQAHLVYGFSPGAWIALNATGYEGGRTTLDGERRDDLQRNTRVGVTLAIPLNRRHSLKFNASTGTSTRIGGDFDGVGMLWQYRWGGGLP